MKLLFLRSQLVDVEFGAGDRGNFGDVELGFDRRMGRRRALRWRRNLLSGSSGAGLGNAGGRTNGSRRRLRSGMANGVGDSLFERATRPGLQGQGCKARKHVESRGKRSGSSLRAKHGRERIGRFAARTGGNQVVDGLMELVAGALDALEVVAQGSGNGLFHGAGFGCHTCSKGRFARFSPVLPFWGVGAVASTGWGWGVSK